MKFTILIADDEKNIREGLGRAMEMDGHDVVLASNGAEAWRAVESRDVDLVITDLRMPEMSGEDLLRKVVSSSPTISVIILTGHGTIESAVQATRDGAYDFLTKPVNLERLSMLVSRALSRRELVLQHRMLQAEVERQSAYGTLIGKSAEMRRVFELVEQVSPSKISVLITGESGVGKERIADAVHYHSPRKEKPFIKVHCAALSETLLESELFGHERGAFTGAIARKRGRFELAHTGTLFLDEIGEISPSVQIKLLRVLEEKSFERVGGEETIEVDVRIISATNRDLRAEIAEGRFREDLYYRLNVVNVNIPPLRERKDDVGLLAAAFLKEYAKENAKPIIGIDTKAKMALYNHGWPGNVRELRNCMESSVVLAKGDIITLEDLPPTVANSSDANSVKIPLGITLAESEKEIIRVTLAQNRGNKSRSAEILGIGRKTLHRKIQEYGLE